MKGLKRSFPTAHSNTSLTCKTRFLKTSNEETYREIVNKSLTKLDNTEHASVGYIDDVSHVTAAETKEEVEIYVNELYQLLEKVNNNKKLQINGTKTQLITLENKNDDDFKIKIKVDNNK